MNLVTVFKSFNAVEAQLVRSQLEAAEFHAVVTDELAAFSTGGYSMAVGGIRVQVPEEEAEEAKTFLTDGESFQ